MWQSHQAKQDARQQLLHAASGYSAAMSLAVRIVANTRTDPTETGLQSGHHPE